MEHLSKGLTLIELCTSLAVLSILTAIAVPDLGTLLPSNRRDNYIRALSNQLKAAKSYAILTSGYVSVCPIENNQCVNSWQNHPIMVFADTNKNLRIDADETIYRILDKNDNKDILTFPRKGIVYKSDGSLAGFYNGSFLYCSGNTEFNQPAARVTVSSSGRVRIKKADDNC